MKPREFYKILEDFVADDKRWRALKVGDFIYESRFTENGLIENEVKIEAIDLDERQLTVRDINKKSTKKIGSFLTQKEYISKTYYSQPREYDY